MGSAKNKGQVRKGRDLEKWKNNRPQAPSGCIRIIGGQYRGQTLLYSGDRVTRPMKDNVREALFNLVGGYLEGTITFDLFAGTGAVGLEALSRRARHAVLIERHVPTTKIIRQNVESLGVSSEVTLCGSDTFFWSRQFFKAIEKDLPAVDGLEQEILKQLPWAVFCCPPYDLLVEKTEEIVSMMTQFQATAPHGSLIVVESDSRFDPNQLPKSDEWDCRQYAPALLSVWKNNSENIDN